MWSKLKILRGLQPKTKFLGVRGYNNLFESGREPAREVLRNLGRWELAGVVAGVRRCRGGSPQAQGREPIGV